MVNFIRNESSSSGSDNEDFILGARFGRKREREASEADEPGGTSHKRIRKVAKDDGDFRPRRETQVFQKLRFTSPFVSQPEHAGSSASFLAADYCAPGSPYQGRSGSSKMATSEKAEVVSDDEQSPIFLTPPDSPIAAPASSSSSSSVHASPATSVSPANIESSVFVKPAVIARKIFNPPPTPRKPLKFLEEEQISRNPFASLEKGRIPKKTRVSSEKKQEEQKDPQICFKNALKYRDSLQEVFNQDPRIMGEAIRPGRQDALLGKGEFVTAHLVRFESIQVVKVHHLTEHIRSPDQLIDCLASELEQYIFLKGKGFPVITYFSFEEFLARRNNRALYEDINQPIEVLKKHLKANFLQPFYRVEYVPYSIANTKEEFESRYEGEIALSGGNLEILGALLKDQNDPLCQVKKMFEFAWKEDVCLDLCLGNLRIRKGGEVVLSDLYYDHEEEFRDHIKSCLLTYVNDINSPLLDYLISSLPEEAKERLASERKKRSSLSS